MNKIKILIVEDEVIVALDIKNEVLDLGYAVTATAKNYTQALSSVQSNMPDLILMDISLRNSKDGIETAIAILKIKKIPIIYLTAYCDDEMIQRASTTNPVGYLSKPFNPDNLRVILTLACSKLNINEYVDNELLNIGLEYYVDMKNQYVYKNNEILKFSRKEFQLLKLLILAKGTIISFKQLEYEIWSDSPVSDNSLRNLVHRLRTKFDHELIENIHGLGFRLTLPL